jgi:hypothetical protein
MLTRDKDGGPRVAARSISGRPNEKAEVKHRIECGLAKAAKQSHSANCSKFNVAALAGARGTMDPGNFGKTS